MKRASLTVARCLGALAVMALAGCSSVIDVGGYSFGGGTDAGKDGSMAMDAGPDAANPEDAAADTSTPPEDAGQDAGASCMAPMYPPPNGNNCMQGGSTFSYVVNVFQIAQGDPAGEVAGFNLDGACTKAGGATGCGKADGFYDIDADGMVTPFEMGVDNQLAALGGTVTTFLDFQSLVDTGNLIVLVRVQDVDDPMGPSFDSCVQVTIMYGVAPDPLVTDMNGRIAPNQTFTPDPASVPVTTTAQIRGGRLIMPVPLLELIFDLSGISVMLPIGDAQAAFDVHPMGLTNGVLGGSIDVDTLVGQVSPALMGSGLTADAVRGVLEPLADMEPNTMDVCQSISTAFTFGAVPATIAPP